MKKSLIIFLLILMLSIVGCNFDPFKPITSGDFIYTLNGNHTDEGHCRIIGLSEEGKQKDVIIFPSVLDGYIVDGLAADWALGRSSGEIIITNAEKIFIPSDYMISYLLNFELNPNKDINVYVTGFATLSSLNYYYCECENQEYIDWNQLFVTETAYNRFYSKNGEIMKLEKANVVYYVNKEAYFVDDCDGTIVNVIPPIPYMEGYQFLGWYKEPECINEWDFESDIVDEKEYDEEGNYIFKETKIYAKWKKVI